MVKRSLYYLSKMYEEQLNEKEDYSKLARTVCINILNFKYLKTDNFHTGYRFKEIESNEELTDIMEVHFIEIPKLQYSSDEKDMLVAWTEFLKDPESETVRGLELSIEEIRQAKDELIRMSNDSTQRKLYDMRANSLRDKISELNAAERKGIEKGKEEGRKEEKSLILGLHYGMSCETLSHNLDLSVEDTKELMNAYFTRYSSTAAWRQECLDFAKETGYVKTIFGDKLKCDKGRWATQGFNYVLQNGRI